MTAGEQRQIGVGLIGAGWMGTVHASAYRRVTEHYPRLGARPRLMIVADPVEERARTTAERYGFERWTTDADEVVSHPDVEAVSLTTPNNQHMRLAIALAETRKHFWGEKPLGRYPEETLEIAAAALRADIRTLIGYNYRHAPAVVRARELIAAGELGEVRTYRGVFLVDYASHPQRALSWRFLREVSGLGVLGDLMSHVVDMALSLAGPIESVTADTAIQIARRPLVTDGSADQFTVGAGELEEVENEDYVASLARFTSGARATFEVSRVNVGHPVHMAFEVRGTRGAVSWDFERMGELQVYLDGEREAGFRRVFAAPGDGEFGSFQPEAGNPMSYDDLKAIEAHLFLQSIIDGVDPMPSVREAAATAHVLAAMQGSSESGGWVSVDNLPRATPETEVGIA